MQKMMPTKAAADAAFDATMKQRLASTDANDMLYQFDASRDYNPEPKLESIKTQLLAINSADDAVNPPELGIAEREIKRVTAVSSAPYHRRDPRAWHYPCDLGQMLGGTVKSIGEMRVLNCLRRTES